MIDIIYKCRCMNREAGVKVKDRTPLQTVQEYIEGPIRLAISRDHRQRAPKCRELITEYVGLPFDASDPTHIVGTKIIRH